MRVCVCACECVCIWLGVRMHAPYLQLSARLNAQLHMSPCFQQSLWDTRCTNPANAKYFNLSFVTCVLTLPLSVNLFAAAVAVAQRVVTVQSGPLIRTEGSHVTIWCNVSGYKEGMEQDFEWSMYLPSAPDREIRIVSTAQPNYAYALYAQRVNNREIYVERLNQDSAMLHITKVLAKDQGLYECYTPNTDGRYLGSYSARTNLTSKLYQFYLHKKQAHGSKCTLHFNV